VHITLSQISVPRKVVFVPPSPEPMYTSQATLEDIVVTHELRVRPTRPADLKAEVEALHDLVRIMAKSPNRLADVLLQHAMELSDADTAGLSLLETTADGQQIFRWTNLAGTLRAHVGGFTPRDFSPCGVCLDRKAPQLLRYPAKHFQYLNDMHIPIIEALVVPVVPVEDHPLGAIWLLSHHEGSTFDSEHVRIVASLAEFAGSALSLVRTVEAERQAHAEMESLVEMRTSALRRLSLRLLQTQDEERRRIARELHDGIGQYLASLKMNLDQLQHSNGPEERANLLSECLEAVKRGTSEARTMSYLLHPPLLDEIGFASAARWYAEGFGQRSGIRTKLDLPPELDRLPEVVELTLFRILQESLTNVRRHSGSATVEIQLRLDPQIVVLEVTDFGKGMPAEALRRFRRNGANMGVGLCGMRERLADLDGELDIRSDASGTTILVTIPLRAALA
jgi:signal transduction histidine kinase